MLTSVDLGREIEVIRQVVSSSLRTLPLDEIRAGTASARISMTENITLALKVAQGEWDLVVGAAIDVLCAGTVACTVGELDAETTQRNVDEATTVSEEVSSGEFGRRASEDFGTFGLVVFRKIDLDLQPILLASSLEVGIVNALSGVAQGDTEIENRLKLLLGFDLEVLYGQIDAQSMDIYLVFDEDDVESAPVLAGLNSLRNTLPELLPGVDVVSVAAATVAPAAAAAVRAARHAAAASRHRHRRLWRGGGRRGPRR